MFCAGIRVTIRSERDLHSVFETTIRYLGGLLSVYELRGEKDAALLERAQDVADKLAFAWVEVNTVRLTLTRNSLYH